MKTIFIDYGICRTDQRALYQYYWMHSRVALFTTITPKEQSAVACVWHIKRLKTKN